MKNKVMGRLASRYMTLKYENKAIPLAMLPEFFGFTIEN
jgi:hypothetical protein